MLMRGAGGGGYWPMVGGMMEDSTEFKTFALITIWKNLQ